MTKRLNAGIVCLAMIASALPADAAMMPIAGDPITTASGKIAGTELPSGVHAYLGIPYAKPPVRDLRWQPPQPMAWSGLFNADRFGAECVQVLRPHNINHYFGEELVSEDCLNMNIWTPATRSGAKLPVIVFIYGGGGTVGSANPALYSGEEVAKHGAIFVNFNYRVGLLGFMAHPALSQEQGGHSGNYGYLDQNAALRWIHDNIAAFGGDPEKVIITGQSFGAGSVAAQLASPLSKGLFRGAAMWSGCNLQNGAVPLAEAEKVGEQVQQRMGAASLADMRNVPADRILALQEEHQLGANVHGFRAPATIDGYFWRADKTDAMRQHLFNDVPIIASSNGDDLDSNRYPLVNARTVAEYQAMASRMFGTNAPEFLRLFPVKSDADVPRMAHRAAQETGFLEQSRVCGDHMAQFETSRTYVDLFDHKHPYAPGVKIADQNIETIGAYHTSDVPYWFGTFDAFNLFRTTRNWTDADHGLSEVMMGSLISLANTGSPSTGKLAWPAWTGAQPRFVRFDLEPKIETMDLKRMDWLAAHPAAKIEAPSERSSMTRD